MVKIERIYWYIAASIIIFLLDYAGLLVVVRRPIDQVVIPFKSEIFKFTSSIKNFSSNIFLYPQLAKITQQNYDLSKNQEELQIKLRQLSVENAKLRVQLEAPFPSSYKFAPAQVISFSSVLEVDSGSDQGIKTGQIVVDGETLIGKVSWVSPRRSKIMLLTDPDFKIAAVTSRGIHGEVIGQGGRSTILSKVLQKDPLFLDDVVTTSGEEFTPANLLIGKITHITLEEAATYKQAKIEPTVNFDREKLVFIITSL
ncbi:rod shape-determining protein MreC [Candidatus Gottesmanbacteria bacterium]|nr:rod shape-determining protein MreC [Candidatus Gottesmanbacteria bacterium]